MFLLNLAKNIKGFAKIPKISNDAVIDDVIFKMHYRVTAGFLFLFSALTTGFNFVGEPMTCLLSGLKGRGTVPPKFINTYCWVQSTFTLPEINGGPGSEHPYLGIGPDGSLERRYHSYYQWVPLVLFLQGAMFYAPRWFWKNWENKRIEEMSEGLRGKDLAADRTEKTQLLINYIPKTLHQRNIYAFGYYFCVFWNFTNVISNIYLIDSFLGHAFMNFGTDVLIFADVAPMLRSDPMSKIFPFLTKCHFHKYGTSGSIQLYDALCLLPVNVLNEKIYIFIWFWLIVLAMLSATAVIFSLAVLTFPSLRVTILERKLRYKLPHHISSFIREIHVGDFFFLNLLSENLDFHVFREVFEGVSSRVTQNHINSPTESPHIDVADDHPIIFPSID